MAGMALLRFCLVGLISAAAFASAGFIDYSDSFAPDSDLWERWQAHDATSTRTVDFAAWDGLLERYLEVDEGGIARFDYGAVTSADSGILDALIEEWGNVPVSSLSREQQMVYWINLYNALTVQVVVEHYPVDSITNIDISGFFSNGPWDAELIEVEGTALTLNDIEHRILRPIWNDPRLHYALNCASIGCPNLLGRAWRAENIGVDLDAAARTYVNNPRGFRIDADGSAIVSKIYAWFVEDFGGDEAGVVAHLKTYAEGGTAAALESLESLSKSEYDWSLNAPLR